MRFDAVFFDSGGTLFDYAHPPTDGTPSFEAVAAGRARRLTAALRLSESMPTSDGLADFEFAEWPDLVDWILA